MLTTDKARPVALIEDDATVRRLLEVSLRLDPRFSLAGSFPDAPSALEAVDRGCPEAMVLDIHMPKMSGMEALPLLREHCPGSVIVVYTAYPEDARNANKLGADAVVSKDDSDNQKLFNLLATLSRAS